MKQFLVSLLAVVSLPILLFLSNAHASASHASATSDGAQGRAILRLHGGTVYADPDPGTGPGWLAGGAVGMGIARNVVVTANYDHFHVDQGDGQRVDIDPVTVQLEIAKPFQRWISPRLEVGGGVYVRSRPPNPVVFPTGPVPLEPGGSSAFQEYGRRTDSPFGINMGGGLSFLLSRNVMLDLGARYHQLTGRRDTSVFTTVSAGLTIGLSRGSHGGDWAGTSSGTLIASR
jgi:opacity protein-like surface antigen